MRSQNLQVVQASADMTSGVLILRAKLRKTNLPAAVAVVVAITASSAALVLAGSRDKPDLVVSSVTAPAQAEPGEQISVADTTKNLGLKTAKSSATGYFLSTDTTKDGSDAPLPPNRSVPSLKKKKSSASSGFTVTVPSSATPGMYRVIACADTLRKVSEKSEKNNCRAAATATEVVDGGGGGPSAPALDSVPSANDNSPEITGTADEGNTVTLFTTPDCSGAAAATTDADQDGDFSFSPSVPDDSVTSFSARAEDDAGADSACSNTVSYVEDSTPPSAPTGLSTSPVSPGADNQPNVRGNAVSGSTVSVYASSDCTGAPLTTGLAVSGGTFDYDASVASDSITDFTAIATDAVGNSSACSEPVTYIEDSTSNAPSNLATSPGSPADDETPHVTGLADQGSTVTIYKSASCGGAAAASGTATDGAFDIEVSVTDGSTTNLTARAVDPLGNQSPCSASVAYQEIMAPPSDEPNDAPGTATAVTADGSQRSGDINPVADPDWYSFAVPAGGSVTAQTFDSSGAACATPSTIDTILRLYAPNGTTVLAENNDIDAGNRCSRIDPALNAAASNLAAGTYYVRVTGDGATTFDYKLSLTASVPALSELEPNNSSSQADAASVSNPNLILDADKRIAAAISPIADADVFKVTSPGSERVALFETLSPNGTACAPGIKTLLDITNTSGTPISNDTTSGLGTCSAIAREVPNAGAYARVRDVGNDEVIPAYHLRTEYFADAGSESEDNDTFASADTVSGSHFVVSGDHQDPADTDIFAVPVPSGGTLRLETVEIGSSNADFESCESGGMDTFVRVFNPAQTQLAIDDDDGRTFCSLLDGRGPSPADPQLKNLAAGTYYVEVAASDQLDLDTAAFDYRLAIGIE